MDGTSLCGRHRLLTLWFVVIIVLCIFSGTVPIARGETIPPYGDAASTNAYYDTFRTQAIYLINTSFLQNETAYGNAENYDPNGEGLVSFWMAICEGMGPFEYLSPFYTANASNASEMIPNGIVPLENPVLRSLIVLWCPTGKGTILQTPIFWSTTAPPGVYNYTFWENMTMASTFSHCSAVQNVPLDAPLMHHSEDHSSLELYPGAGLYPLVEPWSTTRYPSTISEDPLGSLTRTAKNIGIPENFFESGYVGGLGVGSICAGARFSTFILQLASNPVFIVQSRALGMKYIGPIAIMSSHQVQCGNTDGCTSRTTQCLMQVINSEFSGVFWEPGEWVKDGGLFFEMFVTMCNESLSETVSRSTAQLLREGFNGIIATSPALYNKLVMPGELIEAVLSWISASRGNWQNSLFDSTSCFEEEEEPLFYTSGKVAVCNISAQMAGGMPTLYLTLSSRHLLSVKTYDVINIGSTPLVSDSQTPSTGCTIGIDLNKLVDPENFQLRLYSSGSMDGFLRGRVWLREPLVVIGAGLLKSATIATTRNYMPDDNVTNTDYFGLPVMMLTAAYPFLKNSEMANSTALMCVARVSCASSQMYFNAINKCGATWCIGSITVVYDPETLQCKLSAPWLVAVILLLAVVGISEVVLVFVRNRVRREILSGSGAVNSNNGGGSPGSRVSGGGMRLGGEVGASARHPRR